MQIVGSQSKRNVLIAFLVCLLFGALALDAQPAQLWPRFSQPTALLNVQLAGNNQSGTDYMATVTFQGAYNQNQPATRMYLSTLGDDPYWLAHAVPSTIPISQFSFNTADPDGALKSLLSTYGSTIHGYYICDPYNIPESCNMAMTLAGIYDAMVVNPDNLTVMQASTVPLIADLRNYVWVGNYSPLVNNTTINQVSNPSGGSGTTGWSTSGGTVSTGTATGTCAGQGQTLKYVRTSGSGDAWTYATPSITASATTRPYIFSVQVCVESGSSVFLDAWNGGADVKSGSVAAGSGWQTLQLFLPIPISHVTGNTTIKLQVRTSGSSTSAFFHNAAAIGNRVAVDTYQYTNQLSLTNSSILAQDFPTSMNLRDYQIAGKMFTFDLSSDNADEVALYNNILTKTSSSGTARAHNTPIMGYIDDEGNDVAYLSGSGRGLFLNASDNYNNGSVWASMPQPSSLSQPAPVSIAPVNNTIYVAFAASDGDNLSIVQHQNVSRWTAGQHLGAVPMAWTVSPGMIYNSPGIISNYYQFLPQSQEIMAGPSGVGYGTSTTGSDISPFASLTHGFMGLTSMNTVTSWISSSTDLTSFALDVNVPHVVRRGALAYSVEGNSAHTVLDGQAVDYHSFPADEITAIQNVAYTSGVPNYIEVLNDNLTTPPDDVLYIAQQLQLHGAHPYVFMTPSELAATEYASGSQPANAQAVAGSTLTTAFPQNMIWNANGQEPGAGVTRTSWDIGGSGQGETLYTNQDYLGGGNMKLLCPKNTASNCYAYEYLGPNSNQMVVGRYYRFSVNVAGTSGSTAFMTIYDGTANHQVTGTVPASGWLNLSQVIQMQNATTGQIQVGVTPSTTTVQTLYFGGTPGMMPGWYYSPQGGGTASTASFGSTTYGSAQGASQAFYLNDPANDGSQWIAQFPTVLSPNTTYTAKVDVAGTGIGYLDLWNGSSDATSSQISLSNSWKTITVNATTGASTNGVQFEVRAPSSSAAQTVYFRNASLVPTSTIPNAGFITGLESGDTPLSWTNTVDNVSPGGGVSSVGSTVLQSTSAASHGGSNAIQYSGTASGGGSVHAYMEAFSNSTTLSSASRLSYWIFPQTPYGLESGASSMTGLNSTCAAIDIIFTDGTALRNLTAIKDQYGNQMHPAQQCNHLQPDQWNYVTADLSSLSGKIVSRIDVGYDQPGASGNYGGYVDDIVLSH